MWNEKHGFVGGITDLAGTDIVGLANDPNRDFCNYRAGDKARGDPSPHGLSVLFDVVTLNLVFHYRGVASGGGNAGRASVARRHEFRVIG